ncbi:hypothetical protein BDZ91DRAFT_784027 [Kalaharituber pfeilii]|nr:hypothetical protein BDZ91DRAFT_784027 [Kalaharituber pfeilii]
MEHASAQLSQPLPALVLRGTTSNPSVQNERLSVHYMHLWDGFIEEVRAAISGVQLTGMISRTNVTEGEVYYVGNELGLTARFIQNVAVATTKAFQHGTTNSQLNSLRFGDYHSAQVHRPSFPDIVIIKDTSNGSSATQSCELRAVGELETFWTLPLQEMPISAPRDVIFPLERPMGQLASFMTMHRLKYGFLSTYEATVFVRRTDALRFELSPPILWNAANPSVRECFLALGLLLTDDQFQFPVGDSELPTLSPMRAIRGPPASPRPSFYRFHARNGEAENFGEQGHEAPQAQQTVQSFRLGMLETELEVTDDTLFLGTSSKATSVVQLHDVISGIPGKKCVFSAVFEGRSVVVKCWPPSQEAQYENEVSAYLHLNSDEPCFPQLLQYGRIICGGSTQREGFALILTKMPGTTFNDTTWHQLGEQGRHEMKVKLLHAIEILRERNLVHGDATKNNVLYDPETKSVVLVDFEDMVDNTDYQFGVEGPEIISILRKPNECFRHSP